MSGWTFERVQQLAPDAASAKAGQGLASARHWASSGADGHALWGECQGSGAKPYQVRIDLSEPAFKCSCPSRKFPCKHAIGLMLLNVNGTVPAASPPTWVTEWFAERESRAEKKREKADAPPKPVNPEAQQKRKDERLNRIGNGLAALNVWLHDLSRTGIAAVPSRGYAFFDEQARRLVDAQAPGVARRVAALAEIASAGAGWQGLFLEQLALLYLLIRGFERRDALPEATRETLLSVIGVARSHEEVLALSPETDRWLIIAQEVTAEDRLRAQHTWLLGERSRRLAQIIHFAHGAEPLDASLPVGHSFDGEICFFPGDHARALVRTRGASSPTASLANGIDLDTLLDQYATLRSLNPWLDSFVAVIAAAIPRYHGGKWSLLDANHDEIPMRIADELGWRLLALSGGHPVDLVVHFDGRRARPLALIADGEHIRLTSPTEAA